MALVKKLERLDMRRRQHIGSMNDRIKCDSFVDQKSFPNVRNDSKDDKNLAANKNFMDIVTICRAIAQV